jgi:hypothetical protein
MEQRDCDGRVGNEKKEGLGHYRDTHYEFARAVSETPLANFQTTT